MRAHSSDVIVVGGGIMGSSTAFFLAQRGLSVTLLERDLVGQHASGTNYGGVRRQGRPLYQLPLANRSSAVWRRANALLESEVEYLQSGHIRVCYRRSDEDAARMAQYAVDAREYGLNLEYLEAPELQARFPFLGPEVMAGSVSVEDGHANPRLAAPAFARAARRHGALVEERTRIIAVEKSGDDFRVESANQRLYKAPVLVLTTGAWASELSAQFGEPVPLVSWGPTMSVTEPVTYGIQPSLGVYTTVKRESVYFRQIPRGNIIIGGSTLAPGYPTTGHTFVRPQNTLAQLQEIRRLAPAIGQLNIIRVWSGTEGYMPDGQPVLGPSEKVSGLFYGFGFSGSGFQIGPGVGETLAELIATGATPIDLSHYRLSRFTFG